MNVLKIYINKLLDTDLDMITPVLTLLSPLTCVLGILKNKANVAQPSQCCFCRLLWQHTVLLKRVNT